MIKAITITVAVSLILGFNSISAQELINFRDLENRVLKQNDTLYVVNFWATWCKPCIAELPAFEKAGKHFKKNPVKILLISLDFKSDIERVRAFVKDKEIQSESLLLSAGNPNDWINKIDLSWSGAIPATVFYKNNKKINFHEGDFSFETLRNTIYSHIH